MIITPKAGKQYSMSDLHKWFDEALRRGENLEIYPCNPTHAQMLWTATTISSQDDIAALSQWLGGIPK